MAMVASSPVVSYEEARKQRVEENNRKMQALGLFDLSKSLKPVKSKELVRRPSNGRKIVTQGEFALEARRSSRVAGKPAVSYRDQLDLLPGMRFRTASRERQPLARRYLSDTARMVAIDAAEEVFKEIKNPAFVKPMLHSHTASGFWLGLPANFCKEYLPLRDDRIMLEDDKALESECVYLANKVGLSGGWRGFSLDHELVDGDCLIFELVEPKRFKVHIFRCEEEYEGGEVEDTNEGEVEVLEKNAVTEKKKVIKGSDKKAPASAPSDLSKGRKLSTTTSVRKLDLEDGEGSEEKGNEESPKKVKTEVEKDVDGPTRSSRRKRVKEEDDDSKDVVAPQSSKKTVKSKKLRKDQEEGDVSESGSAEDDDGDEDFQKPASQSKDTQSGIRSFGRITRNSAAKLLSTKSK